jgi:hypothetical protein
MGFKKGRAARARVESASVHQHEGDAVDSFKIWHDSGTCVMYTANNGSEYRIDVSTMEQTNMRKGTRRAVYRQQIHTGSTTWTMWQFEARRNGHRLHMRSQYPKWVGFALNERWQSLQISTKDDAVQKENAAAWQRVVEKMSDATFASIFSGSTAPDTVASNSEADTHDVVSYLDSQATLDEEYAKVQLITMTPKSAGLRQALFDRLVICKWSPRAVADAMRWLLSRGFEASGAHCRQIALSRGSVTALRVFLIEAQVDVCGLELLEAGQNSIAKHLTSGNGGWIQHCKLAVKLLLARGAVLGDHGSRSKLLKRLESDGDYLWARRILDAMGSNSAAFAFPANSVQVVEEFLGLNHRFPES